VGIGALNGVVDGPTIVLTFDAHGDNQPEEWEEDVLKCPGGPRPGPSGFCYFPAVVGPLLPFWAWEAKA
jgi:hypothetical protein